MTFTDAVEYIIDVEGGYVNNPDDPGGETKYGISKRSYPDLDIRNLTIEDAVEIYYRDFWTPLGADNLEPRLALLAFDSAVNHGLSRAQRWLRDYPTFNSFLAYRLRFYARLTTFTSFGRGWVNRIAALLDAVSFPVKRQVTFVKLNHFSFLDKIQLVVTNELDKKVRYQDRPRTSGKGNKLDLSRT